MIESFHLEFQPFEWMDIMKDFSDLVSDKTFEKMPYRIWREMDSIIHDARALMDVRVYWDVDDTHCVEIQVIFDYFNDPGGPIKFDFSNGDNSFGDFLYENYLYGYEMDKRREKAIFINPSVNDKIEYSDAYWQNYSLAVLDDTVTSIESSMDRKINLIQQELDALHELNVTAIPMAPSHVFNINTENKKENNVMKFNFDFGPINASMVRMSLYGLAVKNKAGTRVSYDAKAGDIMDVDILNFDGAKFLYKMPVATKDIAIGDVVIHNGIPMFVIDIATNGAYITAVDPINGERKDIMLPKSPFGFNFATKVVNFLGNLNTGADASNPFGNLGLMLMLNDNKDMGDLLPLMLMTGNSGLDMSNPLMLYALMGNDSKSGNDNLLPLMLMMNANKPAAPAHVCNCGGHCSDNHTQG
jgi:hypothetical protein